MKRFISLLLIMLFLVGCTPSDAPETTTNEQDTSTPESTEEVSDTTGAPVEKYRVKELIPSGNFLDGFKVLSQKDHANGDLVTHLGEFVYTDSAQTPKWSLAQWDSGPCIWGSRVESDKYTLTDGVSKWVSYNPSEGSLLLRLNTEAYYNGRGAVEGDYWPHLLVETTLPYSTATESEKEFFTGAADKWLLSFDLRMPQYSATPRNGDWVRAAQLYIYFGARHKETGRFVWFGLQLFDSRWKYSADNYFVDGGKADASGQMIYVIGTRNVYKGMRETLWNSAGTAPQAGENWLHFELDLIPYLRFMVNRGIREGDFAPDTVVDDFYIDYMNYGWEIIGTFDCGVEIKNLSLLSHIEN